MPHCRGSWYVLCDLKTGTSGCKLLADGFQFNIKNNFPTTEQVWSRWGFLPPLRCLSHKKASTRRMSVMVWLDLREDAVVVWKLGP